MLYSMPTTTITPPRTAPMALTATLLPEPPPPPARGAAALSFAPPVAAASAPTVPIVVVLETFPLTATATVAGAVVVTADPSLVTTAVTVVVRVVHVQSSPHWPHGPSPFPCPPWPQPPGPPAQGEPSHSQPVTVYSPPVQVAEPHGPPPPPQPPPGAVMV